MAGPLGFVLTLIYWRQPDALAGLTAIPAWCWALPALVLLLETRQVVRSAAWAVCCSATILYLSLCVEQTFSLPRGVWLGTNVAAPASGVWRVVSLNCLVGTAAVIDDLLPLQPDVVLLQESPSQAAIDEMARRLFGESGTAVSTGDCSILARGPLTLVEAPRTARFVQALWRPPDGPEVMLFSLRLTPPPTRLDYWRASCWQVHRQRREDHRQQLQVLRSALDAVPDGTPIIAGGDFNSPARDAAHEQLRPRMADAFATAGRGWGGTFSRDFAFHRIDLVWLSPELTSLSVTAQVAEHSDHRAVVCDLHLR